eukprot:TRINITY_DN5479_c1_g1_i1.p1 TRINITY_DN5479_c1_g1~~TRINITY_DN5479_c1_g1_i1.p1  ORF type:complete len:306 (+),score=72.16 TRINITY_DN5479_c1_g1_i1:54-920(+)
MAGKHRHQVWGKPELESSSSENSGAQDMSSGSRHRAKELMREKLLEKLKDVHIKDDSSEQKESSSGQKIKDKSNHKPTEAADVWAAFEQLSMNKTKPHRRRHLRSATSQAQTLLLANEAGALQRQPSQGEVEEERGWPDTGDEGGEEFFEEMEGAGTWSKGAAQHAEGLCRPCHYVNTKTGCANGESCSFCHLQHPKRVRPRPCKSKRSKCKRIAGILDSVLQDNPNEFDDAVTYLSSKGGYMKSVVKSKVKVLKETGGEGFQNEDEYDHSFVNNHGQKVLKPGKVSL